MNVPPSQATPPSTIGRRKRAATAWLATNDPQARFARKVKAWKAKRAAKQAKANPALVAKNKRALTGAR